MLCLRLTTSVPNISHHINFTPISKTAIFIGGFSSRNFFSGKTTASDRRKKVEFARFGSFRGGGIAGEDEDDLLTFPNQKMEILETTLNGMSKWLVCGLFAIAIIWKQNGVNIWAAIGNFVNTFISITLKKMLNHERPSAFRSDPGMPSSHAQSIFYALVFSIYSVIERMGLNVSSVVVGAVIFICGAYLSWLRVSQQFHTINQVFVGAALGSVCSLIWLWIWHLFVLRAFDSSIAIRSILFFGGAIYYVALLLYVIHHLIHDYK